MLEQSVRKMTGDGLQMSERQGWQDWRGAEVAEWSMCRGFRMEEGQGWQNGRGARVTG